MNVSRRYGAILGLFPGLFFKNWDRLVGSDPGLARLQMGMRAAIAVGSTLGIEFGFGTLMHATGKGLIVSMLLGAIISMMGNMALSVTTGVLPKIRTAAGFPVAIGIGMSAGAIVSHNTDVMLTVFVVVMFIAVAIRQFGVPFFFYGFMGWMGYFFASFLGATLSVLPGLLLAVVVAAAWVTVLSTTILRTNPQRSLRRTLWAYRARARAFAGVCAELLMTEPGPGRVRQLRRLRAMQIQLSEAALIVEAWSGQVTSLPSGLSGFDVRRYLMDTEYALGRLSDSAQMLLEFEPEIAAAAAKVAELLSMRDDASATKKAHDLTQIAERINHETDSQPIQDHDTGRRVIWRCFAADQFANAALELAGLSLMSVLNETGGSLQGGNDEFEPVVGLFMGNLPGSPAVAADVPAMGTRWNPLARLSLPMRQAIQVGVAGALSILAGRALSPERYYWAVIASFIMFAGTATRTETFMKGFHRVIGTLAGLVVAVWVAELTAGHGIRVVIVIVICIFWGFYLFRISYAYMIFFLTIILGQLYSILHEFSTGLLLLRLEETAIGAAAGFIAALAVVPLSTRDTIRTSRDNLLSDVAAFLQSAADRIAEESVSVQDLEMLSRTVDNRLQQLLLVSRPFTRPFIGASSPVVRHRLTLYALLITDVRALAVALRVSVSVNGGALAEICRDLARATLFRNEQRQPLQRNLRKQMDPALSTPIPVRLNDPVADPVARILLHMQRLLYDLEADCADPL